MNYIKKISIFIFIYLFIDLTLAQLFINNFYYKKLEKQYISDFENRIPNRDYKYTFSKKKSFKSIFRGNEYTVKTNNLGFRDSMVEIYEESLIEYAGYRLISCSVAKEEIEILLHLTPIKRRLNRMKSTNP